MGRLARWQRVRVPYFFHSLDPNFSSIAFLIPRPALSLPKTPCPRVRPPTRTLALLPAGPSLPPRRHLPSPCPNPLFFSQRFGGGGGAQGRCISVRAMVPSVSHGVHGRSSILVLGGCLQHQVHSLAGRHLRQVLAARSRCGSLPAHALSLSPTHLFPQAAARQARSRSTRLRSESMDSDGDGHGSSRRLSLLSYFGSPTSLIHGSTSIYSPTSAPVFVEGTLCDRAAQNNSVLSPKPVHMSIKQ
jgi:hypothetical protein